MKSVKYIAGPPQSGKTQLYHMFQERSPHVHLDYNQMLAEVRSKPTTFFEYLGEVDEFLADAGTSITNSHSRRKAIRNMTTNTLGEEGWRALERQVAMAMLFDKMVNTDGDLIIEHSMAKESERNELYTTMEYIAGKRNLEYGLQGSEERLDVTGATGTIIFIKTGNPEEDVPTKKEAPGLTLRRVGEKTNIGALVRGLTPRA